MKYSELTRRYFDLAPGAGELSGPDVLRGTAGAPAHGTWIQFDLRLAADVVSAARFQAYGCPHTLAVAAFVTEQAVGRKLDAALVESPHALAARFAVPVEKLGRLLLIEDAWRAAASRRVAAND